MNTIIKTAILASVLFLDYSYGSQTNKDPLDITFGDLMDTRSIMNSARDAYTNAQQILDNLQEFYGDNYAAFYNGVATQAHNIIIRHSVDGDISQQDKQTLLNFIGLTNTINSDFNKFFDKVKDIRATNETSKRLPLLQESYGKDIFNQASYSFINNKNNAKITTYKQELPLPDCGIIELKNEIENQKEELDNLNAKRDQYSRDIEEIKQKITNANKERQQQNKIIKEAVASDPFFAGGMWNTLKTLRENSILLQNNSFGCAFVEYVIAGGKIENIRNILSAAVQKLLDNQGAGIDHYLPLLEKETQDMWERTVDLRIDNICQNYRNTLPLGEELITAPIISAIKGLPFDTKESLSCIKYMLPGDGDADWAFFAKYEGNIAFQVSQLTFKTLAISRTSKEYDYFKTKNADKVKIATNGKEQVITFAQEKKLRHANLFLNAALGRVPEYEIQCFKVSHTFWLFNSQETLIETLSSKALFNSQNINRYFFDCSPHYNPQVDWQLWFGNNELPGYLHVAPLHQIADADDKDASFFNEFDRYLKDHSNPTGVLPVNIMGQVLSMLSKN